MINLSDVLESFTNVARGVNKDMTTAKNVILTAINYKGIAQVKSEAKQLAESLLCSESHVLNIIRKVEKSTIVIKGA